MKNNIKKLLIGLILFLLALILVFAQTVPKQSHPASEIEAGTLTGDFIINGKVGIGTMTPNQKLTVECSGSACAAIRIDNTAPNHGPVLEFGKGGTKFWDMITYNDGDWGFQSSTTPNIIRVNGVNNGVYLGYNPTDLDTARLAINGNVGIGTTTPSQKLDVAGYVKGSGFCIGNDCRTSWQSGGNSNWIISGANMYSEVSGKVGIGTTDPVSKLDVRGNISLDRNRAIYFGLEGVTGEYIQENPTGTIEITSGFQRKIVAPSNGKLYIMPDGGDVGIGTTGPGAKLDVAGTIRTNRGVTSPLLYNYDILELRSGSGQAIAIRPDDRNALYVVSGGTPQANYMQIAGSVSGARPVLSTQGTDANIGLSITPKGTGSTIFTNGNVGIGTTTPSQKLDVRGEIHSTGDICTDARGGKCLSTSGPEVADYIISGRDGTYFAKDTKTGEILYSGNNLVGDVLDPLFSTVQRQNVKFAFIGRIAGALERTWEVPPLQNCVIDARTITFSGAGIVLDSFMDCWMEFGVIAGRTNNIALAIQPRNLLPIDDFVGPIATDSRLKFSSIAGPGPDREGSVGLYLDSNRGVINFLYIEGVNIHGFEKLIYLTGRNRIDKNWFRALHLYQQNRTLVTDDHNDNRFELGI